MTERTYEKLDIARQQFDTALRLFFEGADYFSVVTLAGAAEEIFGKELEHHGLTPTLQNMSEIGAKVSALMDQPPATVKEIRDRANHARNNLKHHSPQSDSTVTIDIRQEAIDMLSRAFDNATMLDGAWSDRMFEFNEWFLENEVGA
jgi:hypothetical protein